MKVRKLAVALALAGGLGSGVAQALGLGEIELQSYLNEPLDAEINLRKSEGVDPDEVFVNIASEADYSRVGISRNYFLTKLQFTVTTAPDGSLVVNVSSREPLREPYLNFLLEVTWPSGKLMREYAVLVDPPVYAEESGVREQVAAPATRATQQEPQRQPATRATSPRGTERAAVPTARPGRDTFGPTGPSDTLWGIASDVMWNMAPQMGPGDSVTTQQVMLAIQDLNPDAFIDGNINRLKRGEVLRVPDLEQIRSRTRAEANQQVAVQNRALQQRAVDATDSGGQVAGTAADAAGSDELKLLVADETGSRDAEEGGSAGGDSQLAGGVDAGTAVAMEELERTRRENEELSGRVDDLQEQVETLQRLLELKDSQLAELQGMASETEEGVVEGAPAAEPGDEDAAAPEAEPDEIATGEMADDGEPAEETVAEPAIADEEVASAEEDESEADAMVAAPQQAAPEEPAPDAAPPAPVSSFPGNIIDAIVNNPLYQFALGGSLILLLLLLLLVARRNANREKAFYEQLNDEAEAESDFFELTLDEEDEASVKAEGSNPLAEADTYIAYGRMDQAAQSLENAISREPSRTDLRLKLLGVYADTQDRASFEKQFSELETLEDDAATAEAEALRTRLEEAEAMPSIDDLESQLHSGPIGSHVQPEETGVVVEEDEGHVSDEALADQYESEAADTELDVDFEGFNLEEDELATEAKSDDESDALASFEEAGEPEEPVKESDEGSIEFDLGGIDFDKDESEDLTEAELDFDKEAGDQASAATLEGAADQEEDDLGIDFDFETETESETEPTDELEADLDLSSDEDLEQAAEALEDKETPEDEAALEEEFGSLDLEEAGELAELEPEEGEALPVSQDGALDESFLDELDAELEKVASEDDEDQGTDEEGSLDDLELDVSDEDLALMEEVADSRDKDEDIPSLDEELGLEDSYSVDFDEEVPALDETKEREGIAEEEPAAMDEDAHIPVADQVEPNALTTRSRDIDESELGDDDDFDFLSGTDEAATKLDLARAYMEMGDSEGARDILEEVALEGSDEQKTEAQELLKNLS